jgi:hypothetical protein
MHKLKSLLAMAAISFTLSGQSTAVSITNGSFEGLPTSVNRDTFNSTLPTGWTTTIQSPDTFNAATSFENFAWSSSNDGGDFAHIIALQSPTLVEGFFQSVAGLTIGQQYEISFEQSVSNSNFANTGASGFIEVVFGSTTQNSDTLVVPSLGSTASWIQQTLLFTATAETQDLTFTARPTIGGQRVELAIDGVSISEQNGVPVPATMMLLSLGLAAVGYQRRRIVQ